MKSEAVLSKPKGGRGVEWDSAEGHLKGFRTSPEFKTFLATVQQYFKDIEEMRHYQVSSAGRKT